jgi:hypothetical protein
VGSINYLVGSSISRVNKSLVNVKFFLVSRIPFLKRLALLNVGDSYELRIESNSLRFFYESIFYIIRKLRIKFESDQNSVRFGSFGAVGSSAVGRVLLPSCDI